MKDRTRPAEAGPETAAMMGGGSSGVTISRDVFVRRLLDLGYRHGDIPIYGSDAWEQLATDDPRKFASVVRAAEAWYRDGEADAIRQRIIQDLADNDMLARWRVRMAGRDVHEAVGDWSRVHEVVTARAAYRERWGLAS
jgi:hypothetical protein